ESAPRPEQAANDDIPQRHKQTRPPSDRDAEATAQPPVPAPPPPTRPSICTPRALHSQESRRPRSSPSTSSSSTTRSADLVMTGCSLTAIVRRGGPRQRPPRGGRRL